jgi:glycosyltransferase involved in cell wall biosynthesis
MCLDGKMKIFFDNVNFNSSSGPNGFGKKLSFILERENEVFSSVDDFIKIKQKPDVQLSFIQATCRLAPIVQRLDGIYFNSEQDFNDLNLQIESTYQMAGAVIFQSEFNKKLTEKFFGKKENSFIIRNGTDLELISHIEPIKNEIIDNFDKVWCCASSWRPHKRLNENIRYFLEHGGERDCLVVAGENPDKMISDPRVFYAGHVSWVDLISIMKRSDYFLHLAWLDHCPNVVIDARASGCHIVCSSAGGTIEIAGKNSTIIIEDEWDFSPVKLYSPPSMDFSKKTKTDFESEIEIKQTAEKYLEVLKGVIS